MGFMREEVTGRIVALIAYGSLVGSVLFLMLLGVLLSTGVPRVVSCVDPETESHTPAVSVEVTSNKRTPITQKQLPWGCTAFFYTPDNGD